VTVFPPLDLIIRKYFKWHFKYTVLKFSTGVKSEVCMLYGIFSIILQYQQCRILREHTQEKERSRNVANKLVACVILLTFFTHSS